MDLCVGLYSGFVMCVSGALCLLGIIGLIGHGVDIVVSVWRKIKSRTGKTVDGTFVKD